MSLLRLHRFLLQLKQRLSRFLSKISQGITLIVEIKNSLHKSCKRVNAWVRKALLTHPRAVWSCWFASQLFSSHSYYKLFRPFGSNTRDCPFNPLSQQKCSQLLSKSFSGGTMLCEASTQLFIQQWAPQIFCSFVKKIESKSPKTYGQSSLLNQFKKCAMPTFEIYRAVGITAVFYKSSRMW